MHVPSSIKNTVIGVMAFAGSAVFSSDTFAQTQPQEKKKRPEKTIEPFTSDKKYFVQLRDNLDRLGVLEKYDSISTALDIKFVEAHPRVYSGSGGYFDGLNNTLGLNIAQLPASEMTHIMLEEMIHAEQDHILKTQFDTLHEKSRENFFLINMVREASAKADKAEIISQAYPERGSKETQAVFGRLGQWGDIAIWYMQGSGSEEQDAASYNARKLSAVQSFFTNAGPENKRDQKALIQGTVQPTQVYGRALGALYAKSIAEEAQSRVENKVPFDWEVTKEAIVSISGDYMQEALKAETPQEFLMNMSGDPQSGELFVDLFNNLNAPADAGKTKNAPKRNN